MSTFSRSLCECTLRSASNAPSINWSGGVLRFIRTWSTTFSDEMLRHLVPQQRHHHLVAGDDDLGDVFLLDDPLQRVDDFLGVMDVEVFDVALIARLRPAALRCAAWS